MARTQIRTNNIEDGGVKRDDLNVTTVGKSVIRKVIQGAGIAITATGADAGTGDATISTTPQYPHTLLEGKTSTPMTTLRRMFATGIGEYGSPFNYGLSFNGLSYAIRKGIVSSVTASPTPGNLDQNALFNGRSGSALYWVSPTGTLSVTIAFVNPINYTREIMVQFYPYYAASAGSLEYSVDGTTWTTYQSFTGFADDLLVFNAGVPYGFKFLRFNFTGFQNATMLSVFEIAMINTGLCGSLTPYAVSKEGDTLYGGLKFIEPGYNGNYATEIGCQGSAQGILVLGNNGVNEIRFGNTAAGGIGRIYTNNTKHYNEATDGVLAVEFATNGNIAVGAGATTHKLNIYGNALIQGTQGYNAANELAVLYMGDTNSALVAKYGVGVYLKPAGVSAGLFVQENTGDTTADGSIQGLTGFKSSLGTQGLTEILHGFVDKDTNIWDIEIEDGIIVAAYKV